jgi:hypothetical protein
LSKEQKAVGYRLILFVCALVAMILLAGFAFSTDDAAPKIVKNDNVSMSETR